MANENAAMKPIIVIPARMASTRLPGKPMMDIAGEPMIVQVWRRAKEADIGPVLVAADCHEIAQAVRDAGGDAVVTKPDHPSGSDRIFEALEHFDPNRRFDIAVNIQGDLPTISKEAIHSCFAPFENSETDIATLAAEITCPQEKTNPNVVKVIGTPISENRLKAHYFTRATAPYGEGPLYHHIGLYAYRREALFNFVHLAPSPLEKREKLEQLRAIEAGMTIHVSIVNDVPLGVDTAKDLERARAILSSCEDRAE